MALSQALLPASFHRLLDAAHGLRPQAVAPQDHGTPLLDQVRLVDLLHLADEADGHNGEQGNNEGHNEWDENRVLHDGDHAGEEPLVVVLLRHVGEEDDDEEDAEAAVKRSEHPDDPVLDAPVPELSLPLGAALVLELLEAPRVKGAQEHRGEHREDHRRNTNCQEPAYPVPDLVGDALIGQVGPALLVLDASCGLEEEAVEHQGPEDVAHEEERPQARRQAVAVHEGCPEGVLREEDAHESARQRGAVGGAHGVLIDLVGHGLVELLPVLPPGSRAHAVQAAPGSRGVVTASRAASPPSRKAAGSTTTSSSPVLAPGEAGAQAVRRARARGRCLRLVLVHVAPVAGQA
eukprot:CAMPEP_0179077094 /NCGR_PEP_ID=MMETSP0796-20121207/34438_1 /TAXON_ID=73915 /ORGANISM="Pyrodinium bahamense, Strain pbaha01" /LENGTH=348 /DNA_ID=CAMNT_0020774365 /DNA_START=368 /DNA_END=1410 /DNA_ORIENTATION=+